MNYLSNFTIINTITNSIITFASFASSTFIINYSGCWRLMLGLFIGFGRSLLRLGVGCWRSLLLGAVLGLGSR